MLALWPMRSIVIWSIDAVSATSTTLATKGPAGNGPKVSGATAPSTSSNHSIAWLTFGTVIPTWSKPTSPSSPRPTPASARSAAACAPVAPTSGAATAALSTPAPFVRNSPRRILTSSAIVQPSPGVNGALCHATDRLSTNAQRWVRGLSRAGATGLEPAVYPAIRLRRGDPGADRSSSNVSRAIRLRSPPRLLEEIRRG